MKQINHALIIRPFDCAMLSRKKASDCRSYRTCNKKIMISQFLSEKSVQFESQFGTNLGKAFAWREPKKKEKDFLKRHATNEGKSVLCLTAGNTIFDK